MTVRVGINGFGRMGRLVMRAAWDWQDVTIVHINEPAGDAASLAHLLTFDSVHGRWHHEATADGNDVLVDTDKVSTSRNIAIEDTDWRQCDIVIEASGVFKSRDLFEVSRATSVAEVNRLLKEAAEGELAGILGYEERPLVSTDYKTDPRSSVIDALSTMVVDHTQVKLYAWYDNEWGYANRTAELMRLVGGLH